LIGKFAFTMSIVIPNAWRAARAGVRNLPRRGRSSAKAAGTLALISRIPATELTIIFDGGAVSSPPARGLNARGRAFGMTSVTEV